MSSRSISQTECVSPLSLADLLATVAASNLPERRRQVSARRGRRLGVVYDVSLEGV